MKRCGPTAEVWVGSCYDSELTTSAIRRGQNIYCPLQRQLLLRLGYFYSLTEVSLHDVKVRQHVTRCPFDRCRFLMHSAVNQAAFLSRLAEQTGYSRYLGVLQLFGVSQCSVSYYPTNRIRRIWGNAYEAPLRKFSQPTSLHSFIFFPTF